MKTISEARKSIPVYKYTGMAVWLFAAMCFLLVAGCSNDKKIKTEIAAKTRSDINFAGVLYSVEGKVVTLTGYCPSIRSKLAVEGTIGEINVVKGIIDKIQIAPVTLSSDLPIKQRADSVLGQYPTIQARVDSSKIILIGKGTPQELQTLVPALNKLHPAGIENHIALK
jgi:hypothetical protein